MSGSYPPGVTGNEPQIAGYPEVNLTGVSCDGEATVPITDDNGKVWHVTIDCPWEGDVQDAQIAFGEAVWDCPLCHVERTSTLPGEED